MTKPLLPILIVSAFASALSSAGASKASAGDILDAIEFSGMIESEVATGTVTGDVEKSELVLTPEIAANLTPTTRLSIIGRLRGDLADDLEPGRPGQQGRSDFSKRLFVGDNVDIALREAYIDTEIGSAFLRIGKQQVVWGQADGLKVLDVINPQSFREFILDDFDESRIPLWTLNAEIPIGETFLQLLWIPDRTYNDIPQTGAAYAFSSPLIIPQAPPGVPVTIRPLDRPDELLGDSDVAVKLSAFLGGWDVSLNYAYHYFDNPVVRRTISATGIDVAQSFERTHLLGGTFSNVFGNVTLRGEIGYSSDRFFLTADLADADGVIGSGEFSYVLGLDYQGWSDWFISAQIFQSFLTSPTPGMIRDDVDTTGTLLLRRDFMNERLSAEALLLHSINQGDGLLQTSLEYEWRSNVRLKIGADIFYGKPTGLFGQFAGNDRVSIGIEIGF
jgi:Protein of unknown function (DUF1302)